MRRSFLPITASLALLLQSATPAGGQPAPPSPAAPGGSQNADLGFDDLMTALIQPRHVKLYYAGMNGNWELAAAELKGLRSSFYRISQRIPRYLNNDVAETLKVIMEASLQKMDATIGNADSKQFESQFRQLTDACNACHVYTEHPFIVMKVPTLSGAYPDQDFQVHPLKPASHQDK